MPRQASDPDHFRLTEHRIDDLPGHMIRGGAITVVAQLAKIFILFGGIVLLARMLTPEDFGLVAVVAAFLAFVELFLDLGLARATAQRAQVTQVEVSTLFWITVTISVLAFLVILGLGPTLARFYDRDELSEVTVWLGLAVVIASMSVQHTAILKRQRRFAALAVAEIGSLAVGILAAVVVATTEGGVWALVAQRIAGSLTLTLSSWLVCRWRPGRPSFEVDLRGLLAFGGDMTLSSALNLASRTIDHILIGWTAGAHVLGLYERTNRLVMAPVQDVNVSLFAAAMPMLGRSAGNPARFRRTYLKSMEAICMVTMPVAALPIAVPDLIVDLLLGPQWGGAAPFAMWLGIAALFQPVINTLGWLFVTRDRVREMVRWTVMGSGLRLIAVLGGLPYGAVGVAAAVALSGIAIRVPVLFWAIGRRGPISTLDLVRATGPATVAAVSVIAALSLMRGFVPLPADAPALQLVLAVGVAAGVALLCYAGLPQGRRALRGFRLMRSAFTRVEVPP